MFATVVVVLPTVHEGGELIFRQKHQEFKFDSAVAVQQSSTQPCVAFAAFFSDVTHEVLEVKLGYRVTITWNVYFSDSKSASATTSSALETSLTAAFRSMLADETFLPDGGYLGFGLRHEYPVEEAEHKEPRFRPLDKLRSSMKGSDAVLWKVCCALSLRPEPKLIYTDNYVDVLCPGAVYLGGGMMEGKMWEKYRAYGGKLLSDIRGAKYRYDEATKKEQRLTLKADIQVHWITRKRYIDANLIKTPYIAYGNQASMAVAYSTPVLVVEVGPAGNRSGQRYLWRPRSRTYMPNLGPAVTRAMLGQPEDLYEVEEPRAARK